MTILTQGPTTKTVIFATDAILLNPNRFLKHRDMNFDMPPVLSTAGGNGEATPEETSFVPDLNQAKHFLSILDPDALKFTFLTFDDNQENKNSSLTREFHGSLEEHWETLVEMNRQGAGVFVAVNQTNLHGRKKGDITQIRAIWQECDNGNEPDLPLEPHLVVESSPGKYHRYVLTGTNKISEFEPVQQRLVNNYGSDPSAKDRSRVLRIPGFFHQKKNTKKGLTGEPFMVRIFNESGQPRLAWDEVKKIFPPAEQSRNKKATATALQEPNGRKIIKIAEIYSALKSAPAAPMTYDDWLKIGMAIHYESGGSQEGFGLWDEWSAKDPARYKSRVCAEKWASFNIDEENNCTEKTLFKITLQHGWNGEFLQNEKKVFDLAHEQRKRMLNAFNERHGVVLVEGVGKIVHRGPDEFTDETNYKNKRFGLKTIFSDSGSMALYHQTTLIPLVVKKKIGSSGKKVIDRQKIFPVWLNWPGRRRYKRVVFRPIKGLVAGEAKETLKNEKEYNLYHGMTLQPRVGDSSEYNLILNHIKKIWCNGDVEHFEYILNWLARLVQKPAELGQTVIVLRSGEGAGKNVIVDVLLRLFGVNAQHVTDPEDLTARFNDFLVTSVFVFLNESVWGGNRKAVGRLKSLITDERLLIERKYLPKFQIQNCSHIIIASNADWVAPVGLEDRRYVYLDLDESRKGDFEYFEKLAYQIDYGGAECFIQFLLDRDIEKFNPRLRPENKSSSNIEDKIRSADTVLQWWVDVLDEGMVKDYDPQLTSSLLGAQDWNESEIVIKKGDLYISYETWCKKNSVRHSEHVVNFWKKIRGYTPHLVMKRPRKKSSDFESSNRVWEVTLPSLQECRDYMSNKYLKGMKWEEE